MTQDNKVVLERGQKHSGRVIMGFDEVITNVVDGYANVEVMVEHFPSGSYPGEEELKDTYDDFVEKYVEVEDG